MTKNFVEAFGLQPERPARELVLEEKVRRLTAEVERLQRIIDSRPAINAALPDSYIRWSQDIYTMDLAGELRS